MTYGTFLKIINRIGHEAGGHFNLTIRTKNGRSYETDDLSMETIDNEFLELYDEFRGKGIYIPYENIELIEA